MQFPLEESMRSLMATEHRAVQTAISAIANAKFGNPHPPQGIGKYQGGVLVNGREICLREHWANDDRIRQPTCDTPEEIAVVTAIAAIVSIIENNGITAIKSYENSQYRMRDPLRSMLHVK
jgi:hypothetical protein